VCVCVWGVCVCGVCVCVCGVCVVCVCVVCVCVVCVCARVSVCDLETSTLRRSRPELGCSAKKENKYFEI